MNRTLSATFVKVTPSATIITKSRFGIFSPETNKRMVFLESAFFTVGTVFYSTTSVAYFFDITCLNSSSEYFTSPNTCSCQNISSFVLGGICILSIFFLLFLVKKTPADGVIPSGRCSYGLSNSGRCPLL